MDTTDQFQLDDEEDCVIVDADNDKEETGDEVETDAARLAQRQKQIAFGKNTPAYQNYIKAVPKHRRKLRGKDAHPSTPDINLKASKRCWAGMLRKWRRSLHAWDAEPGAGAQALPMQPTSQHVPPPPQEQQQQQQQQQQHRQQQQQRTHHATAQQQRGQGWGGVHPYLQPRPQARQQHEGRRADPRGAPPGPWQRGQGGRSSSTSGAGAPDESSGGITRVTPSKRQRGGAQDCDAHGGSDPAQRDTPSKRTRGGQQSAVPAGKGGVPQHKSWADQVADAFGDWNE